MKILKPILKTISVIALLFIAFLVFATITNYQPKEFTDIYQNDNPDTIQTNQIYNSMIWNIGYCGLSADMDFFYDGGTQVRTSKENVLANYEFIKSTLKENDTLDFMLLQEVDIKSKRSYRINEVDSFKNTLSNHSAYFAKNYDVKFVPSPVTNPLGKVKSGLLSFTNKIPKSVKRYSFPGNYDWPVSLFMLDRCFLVARFPTNNNKEFIIINTHNSAYDDGSLKKQQMEFLKIFLLDEFNKGNYIIVGGDWNQNPPDIDYSKLREKSPTKRFVLNSIAADYLPEDWTWIYDSETPTNRYLNTPFEKGKTITPIIDFYLMSPNIKTEFRKTINFNFLHSDHQPVMVSFYLE